MAPAAVAAGALFRQSEHCSERHYDALWGRGDLALITDCGMYDKRTPGVTTALRGMAACQFTLRTAASDLHSGVYGGVAPNAVLAEQVPGMASTLPACGSSAPCNPSDSFGLRQWELGRGAVFTSTTTSCH